MGETSLSDGAFSRSSRYRAAFSAQQDTALLSNLESVPPLLLLDLEDAPSMALWMSATITSLPPLIGALGTGGR